ncbi:hypothetical protein [Candidatus Nitrospira neomarina]|uniref:Peptidase M1 membrane alanine aminopeptidase domain-containing protein n=1 Tax=Candidatus Nitrospira neomarina TaxID=3020899 RepID=A0AA96GNM0_9BACT|nr:hypothetical protein [Candidatus Nitrospira neomarina]WNM62493.1 hypothetical protein PQG83_01740 [Candidatus Nitrospira neomarina]
MSTNFHLAPPPKTVDGLVAVPIDIQTIDAVFVFDGATASATADATITYTVGPTAGNPIFDLRQDITTAWLDGVLFPPVQLAHHSFGTGPFTDLRIVQSVQNAGSVHTLRVQYPLTTPNSQLGGSYLPVFEWSSGPKLRFVFGLSDLNRARYTEAWLPANLIFDQFALSLEIQLVNTVAAHSVITNGLVTIVGANHWRLNFPARFTALSPLLEIHASENLELQIDTTVLPVSGKNVTLEAWKPVASAVNLIAQLNTLKTLLAENENAYGPYLHGNRFVAFFNGSGGMEYEGGTTTSTSALLHETFHSWYARGIKPAAQADGWWDEGFTSFHDDGADDALPFDFTTVPVILCSRDPWQRHTPTNSYSDGSRFWRGMAAMLGVAQLNALMKDIYVAHQGKPLSTGMIEEFLLCKSGNAQVVDAFHRFVYGLDNPSPAPDLWLRDDPADPGADIWGGAFWNSPDLWIRNAEDGGTTHQSPEYGQDNWFHARVRNKASAGAAQHFVVTFHAKGFAGTQFQYPGDFLPCIAARAEFDLAPGTTRIVTARWPRALVPGEGTHTCLLASVISRFDNPVPSRHVWEHNNLAQKNLTVVDLHPNTYLILPVVIANWDVRYKRKFLLEVIRVHDSAPFTASLIHTMPEIFRDARVKPKPFTPFVSQPGHTPEKVVLECGGHISGAKYASRNRNITSATPDLIQARFPQSWEAGFPTKGAARLAFDLPPFNQMMVGLKISVSRDAKPGQVIRLHFVQRSLAAKRIVGGIAVQINVAKPLEKTG